MTQEEAERVAAGFMADGWSVQAQQHSGDWELIADAAGGLGFHVAFSRACMRRLCETGRVAHQLTRIDANAFLNELRLLHGEASDWMVEKDRLNLLRAGFRQLDAHISSGGSLPNDWAGPQPQGVRIPE